MVPSSRHERSALLSERLLITRIITSLGVAFLLVLGVWAAGHTEPDTSAGAFSSTAAAVAVDEPLTAIDAATPVSPLWADAILGAAACLLGVLCGLVLIVMIVRLMRQLSPPRLSTAPRIRVRLTLPDGPRVSVLTLAQLGLSRT